jgi:DNA repair protein RecN (Recombination protein N)
LLLELRVENYAVIENTAVEFASGLNLLTGETGAGKSILIDALALLLGARATGDLVRHGAEKAVLTAVFHAGNEIACILQENGMDAAGEELILRREIAAGGKGRIFINNQPATVAVLKQLAPHLGIIHAQNESLAAFDAAEKLRLLDHYSEIETSALAKAFHVWQEIQQRIAELEREEQDRLRLLDLWVFQKKEIEQAQLEPEEDQRLQTEKKILANAEKLYAAAMSAHECLYESSASAAALIRAAARNVEELARFDVKFLESQAALESARITVEDIGASLREYAEAINASPQRLAEIEDRLALLDRLKRKYGQSLEAVTAFGAEVKRKLSELENRDEILKKLREGLASAVTEYLNQAQRVSKKRHAAARKLEKLVEQEVNRLAMKVQFKVEVTSSEEPIAWSASGFDRANYLIATNPGEPLHPLEEIASGGEMSRVMLALKAAIESGRDATSNRSTDLRTLVFDEIDSGIGGHAAEAVGRKLKSLSQSHQVLCVTHLPQIASFADQHYVVEKREKREAGKTRAQTAIRRLNAAERTVEIARMLSGEKLTETSLKHAEQLLRTST